MCQNRVLSVQFLLLLVKLDLLIVAAVVATRCTRCGGPLHRSDYPRKPRGAWWAVAGEPLCTIRFSLCCGWPGCRRRATPPSVRFLARRVYLATTVILASVALGTASATVLTARQWWQRFGVPRRTARRWRDWWCTAFVQGPVWKEVCGYFAVPLDAPGLPGSLLTELGAFADDDRALERALEQALRLIAPATTTSIVARNGARFVRRA